MLFTKVFTAIALASGMVAAAPFAEGTPFKFGVTVSGKTLYLKANGMGTANKAEGVSCTIVDKSLSCDGKTAPKFGGDMIQLKLQAGKSQGWSLGDTTPGAKAAPISWVPSAGPSKKFSFRSGDEIWAESCPHGHFPLHGTASAYLA
ncbi:hypothetical protein EJ08DRAFT_682664 [Tothia fuscella]|uniref:Uncharacterized protein n=1 Tax=Tothia fuscella TaxID=1048955 RepID=A0A9P4TTG1_9PEZI|nr:hypothetical protein EJ08DRAFT_682664 [Tothia fuscella]